MMQDDPLLLDDPLAETRDWCFQRYLILRAQMGEKEALKEVISLAEAGEGGRSVDKRTVGQWFMQDSWEKAARASRASRLLASDQFRMDEVMQDRMRRLNDARDVLAHIYRDAMKPGADAKLLTAYRMQSDAITKLENDVADAEGKLA